MHHDSDDSSIKTARTKKESASSFCPFAPVEIISVAKVSIGERSCCGDFEWVVTSRDHWLPKAGFEPGSPSFRSVDPSIPLSYHDISIRLESLRLSAVALRLARWQRLGSWDCAVSAGPLGAAGEPGARRARGPVLGHDCAGGSQ